MPPADRQTCIHCGSPLTAPGAPCAHCRGATPAKADNGSEVDLPPVRVGDLFEGKWRIESKLGAGGMGSVFLAHDVALDRKVAIKVLARELCKDAQFVDRFEREARLTARLEHPNVVAVYAVGRHEGRPFMVMKKLEGETLAAALTAAGRFDPWRTLEYMRQICAGLSHIHANECVHRDIKAGNIFIGPDGHATILDFGVLREGSGGNTQAGMMLGTPKYMSPEQARGATDVDHRADLYAMGVLLFECLAGRPPFDSPTDLAIIHAHANTEPPDITALDPSLPPGLGQMLLRSLAKSPDERFQSADQFCAAFEASLSAMPPVEPGKPMAPLPPTPSVPRASLMAIPPEAFEEAAEAQREAEAGAPADGEAAPAEDAAPEAAAAPVPAPKKRRRWLWPAVALGALLLAGAGAGLAFLKFGGHEPEAEAAKPLVVPTRPTTPEPPRPEVPAPGPVAPKKPVKLYGTLKVATVLSGRPYPAAVEVDGVDRGETPVTLELVTGKHRVRVLRAGFQTTDKEVVISHRQTSTVKVDLIP